LGGSGDRLNFALEPAIEFDYVALILCAPAMRTVIPAAVQAVSNIFRSNMMYIDVDAIM
jgi:hypothetical protein